MNTNSQIAILPTTRTGEKARLLMPRALVLLALCAAPLAHAQSIEWISGDGVWSNSENWEAGNIPNLVTEFPVLGGNGSYTVEMDFGYQFGLLSILNPNAHLIIRENRSPGLNGDLINHGLIRIVAGDDQDSRLRLLSDTIITGTGTILISQSETGFAMLGSDWPALHLTNGQGHTISGSGMITTPLTNHGSIIADGPEESSILLTDFNSFEGAHITQSDSGLIYAKTGNIRFGNYGDVTIEGGTIRDEPDTQIIFPDTLTLKDVHIQANLNVPAEFGALLTLEGRITNNSTIRFITDDHRRSGLLLRGETTIDGHGEVILGDGDDFSSISFEESSAITHGSEHTIRGKGQINVPNGSTFVNRGKIIADTGYITLTGIRDEGGSYEARESNRIIFLAGDHGPLLYNHLNLIAKQRGKFMIGSGISLFNLMNEGELYLTSDGVNPIFGGTIHNNGVLDINGDSTIEPGTRFTGNGSLEIDRSDTFVAENLINDIDHRIEVYGELTGPMTNLGSLTGWGTVHGPIENNGLIRPTHSEFNFTYVLTLTGDQIQGTGIYDAGEEVLQFKDSTVNGATLQSDENGVIVVINSTLNSVMNNAVLRTLDASPFRIVESFTNNNTLLLYGQASHVVRFEDSMTVEGEGLIELRNVGPLNLPRLLAANESIVTLNPLQTLIGNGKLLGSFNVQGLIAPRKANQSSSPSPSAIYVDDTTLASSSTLQLDILNAYGSSDQIIIEADGTLSIAGTLDIRVADGVEPNFGEWMLIDGADGSQIIGDFDQVNLPTAQSNRIYRLRRTEDQLALVLTCPSDINADLRFDIADVSAFVAAFGSQTSEGDYNNDGIFDFFDVSAFLTDFNAPCQ